MLELQFSTCIGSEKGDDDRHGGSSIFSVSSEISPKELQFDSGDPPFE